MERFCYTCMKYRYTSSHIYKCINMINNAYFESGQHIVNLQNIILNPWIICLIIWKIILKEKKNKKCKFHNLNCIKKCFRVSNYKIYFQVLCTFYHLTIKNFGKLTSEMLWLVDRKASVSGFIRGLMALLLSWDTPKSTTSFNRTATFPRSVTQLCNKGK